ncbi:MAG: DUF2153 family protein [Sulfolobales archaeon]
MSQIAWVEYLGKVLKYLEEENERIVSGKADRLETVLAIDQALQILGESVKNWIAWIRRPDVLELFDESDWRRVWAKIYEHAKGILTEDMIHTAEYEERIKRTGPRKISAAIETHQRETHSTPTSM